MFDKNQFKQNFRHWMEMHPTSTLEDAKKFCQQSVSLPDQQRYRWLLEECLAWFSWRRLQSPSATDILSSLHFSEEEEQNHKRWVC